jgi:hypothetical protein
MSLNYYREDLPHVKIIIMTGTGASQLGDTFVILIVLIGVIGQYPYDEEESDKKRHCAISSACEMLNWKVQTSFPFLIWVSFAEVSVFISWEFVQN